MLQRFADWLVFGIFGLDKASKWGDALNFFIYDSIKILILLFLISAIMGIINAYLPVSKLKIYLQTHKLYGLQYLLASCFGAITPFCSCSSIPLFIGFVKGGIPLGVTLAFLITSPLVNEVAVAMFLGAFGVKITVIYVVSGILLLGGWILGRMRLEPLLSDWMKNIQKQSEVQAEEWEEERKGNADKNDGGEVVAERDERIAACREIATEAEMNARKDAVLCPLSSPCYPFFASKEVQRYTIILIFAV